jgi:hypothetical protein
MRILALAASLSALALPAAASAQWGGGYYGDRGDYREYRRDVRQAQRECRRDLRRADSRREYRRELRDCRRDLRQAQREYRRDVRNDGYYGRGQGYGYYNNDSRRYWDGYQWRYRY